jgi:hypothetical protein
MDFGLSPQNGEQFSSILHVIYHSFIPDMFQCRGKLAATAARWARGAS